jgi:MerR family transcriptional regulator, heat shock protein HspR
MLSVQPAFLRRLDSEELISPERSDGGQRRYTRSEIDQIHRVSELAGEGLTLAGIRRLLALEAEVGQLKREVIRLRAAQESPRQSETGSSPQT